MANSAREADSPVEQEGFELPVPLAKTSQSLRQNGEWRRGKKGCLESVVYPAGDRGFESPMNFGRRGPASPGQRQATTEGVVNAIKLDEDDDRSVSLLRDGPDLPTEGICGNALPTLRPDFSVRWLSENMAWAEEFGERLLEGLRKAGVPEG
jgi:hypothetical protein